MDVRSLSEWVTSPFAVHWKLMVSQQLKLLKCDFFFFFKFLNIPYFIKKVWKFWVFLRKGNPYLRQDCICNIFPYLKISGNRCIWGQADPFKDVCSCCTREGCDQICCENVFVTHWWSGRIFFANISFEILYKHSLMNVEAWCPYRVWHRWRAENIGFLISGWRYVSFFLSSAAETGWTKNLSAQRKCGAQLWSDVEVRCKGSSSPLPQVLSAGSFARRGRSVLAVSRKNLGQTYCARIAA